MGIHRAVGAVGAICSLVVACNGLVDLGPERRLRGETENNACSIRGQGVVWAQQFGDASYQVALSVSAGGGGVYVAGVFTGATDFGGGPLISAGLDDYFVARFDTKGNHSWSKRFGDSTNQGKTLVRVRATPDGGVLFHGELLGTVELGPGVTLTASVYSDGFVARYSAAGDLLWWHVVSSAGSDAVTDVAIDPISGEIAVTARYEGPVLDFANAPVVHAGLADILLAKLDADGNAIWSQSYRSAAADQAEAVAIDPRGRIAMAGAAHGPLDFGGGLRSAGQAPDAFVAVYDSNGVHQWSQIFAAPGFQNVGRMAIHPPTGDLILLGAMRDNGAISLNGPTITANTGAFLARLTADGTYVASRALENFFVPRALDVDAQGNAFISGPFNGVIDFGGGPITCAGMQDGVAAKFGPGLEPVWTLHFGSTEDDNVYGIATDGSNTYVGAYFQSEFELEGCGSLTSTGGADALLIKLDR